MKYETFKHLVVEQLQSYFKESIKITIEQIKKNNGLCLDGLIILEKDMNIAPTIYLNYYFEKYESGSSFSEVFEELLSDYEENRPLRSINVSFFTEFDRAKTQIVFKLVNYNKNKDMLTDIPYFHYLDLAIVFYCLVHDDLIGNASILIQNRHIQRWAINEKQLLELAIENTPRLLKYEIRSMQSILSSETDMDVTDLHPMYVLTNTCRLNGACCILYKNLLQNFADSIKSDFYILPSSIHEVILLPSNDKSSIHEISRMVQDVNQKQVSPEELLSDHAYYYSREEGCVSF